MVQTRPFNEALIRDLALWARNYSTYADRDKLDNDDVADLVSILFDTKVRHGYRDGYDCCLINDNRN